MSGNQKIYLRFLDVPPDVNLTKLIRDPRAAMGVLSVSGNSFKFVSDFFRQ